MNQLNAVYINLATKMHSFFILTTTMSILKKVKPGFQMSVHEAD